MLEQGSKDVEKVKEVVSRMLKGNPNDSEGDEYRVHMAVLTASMGKRVTVVHGNLMSSTVQQAVSRVGGTVRFVDRSDEVGFFVLARVSVLQCLN